MTTHIRKFITTCRSINIVSLNEQFYFIYSCQYVCCFLKHSTCFWNIWVLLCMETVAKLIKGVRLIVGLYSSQYVVSVGPCLVCCKQ